MKIATIELNGHQIQDALRLYAYRAFALPEASWNGLSISTEASQVISATVCLMDREPDVCAEDISPFRISFDPHPFGTAKDRWAIEFRDSESVARRIVVHGIASFEEAVRTRDAMHSMHSAWRMGNTAINGTNPQQLGEQ